MEKEKEDGMAVNAGERNVPDTPQNRQFDACEKTMELALHTIQICKNKKIFTVEYQEALTNDIIRCAKDIYVLAWRANNIYTTVENGRWPDRERLQQLSISKCNELIALINIARRLFHLKGKKVRYWTELVVDAKTMLRKWHDANADQYRA